MAYVTAELEVAAIQAIKDNNLVFIDEVPAYLPCSLKTFYNNKLHEVQELKEALEINKISLKNELREKWRKSDNPTLQMALYKLLATETERRQLAMEYHRHSHENEHQIIRWEPAQ